MGWSVFQIIVVIGMVATGTLNTISAGYQQRQKGKGRDWASEERGFVEGKTKNFDHPYLQAMGMMLGECLCMIAFLVMTRIFKRGLPGDQAKTEGFSPLILYPAALFDLIGTSLNYVGMILSTPSSFQMLRGSVIVFTAGLSIVLLKRWPKPYQWLGIVVVICGLIVVGAGDLIYKEEETYLCVDEGVFHANHTTTPEPETTTYREKCVPNKLGSDPLTGDIIIVVGEIFHAFQFIYEEVYLTKYDLPPLKVVGYEGIFGFTTIGILLWPFYFIYTGETFGLGPEYRFEDAIDGFSQIFNSPGILGWTIGNMFSIAMFNFAGVTVTKELSSTTRAVLDNIRQIFIWAFSLIVGWQTFNWMTPVGFVVLIMGIWLYNDVIIRPVFYKIIGKEMPK